MAALLVSDTSVLIDLVRGDIVDDLFRLPLGVAVPDVLFTRELEGWDGPDLRALGLQVIGLEPDGVSLAQRYGPRIHHDPAPDAARRALVPHVDDRPDDLRCRRQGQSVLRPGVEPRVLIEGMP